MKITDAIGNELRPGVKLYWKQADLMLVVKEVGDANKGQIATLKLELDMGVEAHQGAASFPMFIRVVSPIEDEHALKLMEKARAAS